MSRLWDTVSLETQKIIATLPSLNFPAWRIHKLFFAKNLSKNACQAPKAI